MRFAHPTVFRIATRPTAWWQGRPSIFLVSRWTCHCNKSEVPRCPLQRCSWGIGEVTRMADPVANRSKAVIGPREWRPTCRNHAQLPWAGSFMSGSSATVVFRCLNGSLKFDTPPQNRPAKSPDFSICVHSLDDGRKNRAHNHRTNRIAVEAQIAETQGTSSRSSLSEPAHGASRMTRRSSERCRCCNRFECSMPAISNFSHFPGHEGFRFSANALRPSLASSVIASNAIWLSV